MVARQQSVKQGGACAANMQHSSRGGRETGNQTHGFGWGLPFGQFATRNPHQHAGDELGKRQFDTSRSEAVESAVFHAQILPCVAVATCFGAAGYFSLPFEPGHELCLALVCSALLLFACVRLNLSDARGIGLLLSLSACGFVVGFVSGKISTIQHAQPVLADAAGPLMVEGWITEIEPARRGHRLRIAVQALGNLPAQQALRSVRLTQIRPLEADVGRYVQCWSVLRPPPAPVLPWDYAFDRQAYFEQLDAVGYVQGACRAAALAPPAGVWQRMRFAVSTMRRQTAHYVDMHAGDRAGGFAAALMSGDRSLMTETDREALRRSGLAHLMAISGLHMGLVCGLVFVSARKLLGLVEPFALRWPPQKGAAFAALAAGAAYLIMSGASVSTQRAYIMAMVFFAAICVDRRALSLQSLSIAMLLIVLCEPWSVLTPGFQMSFAATGALVTTYEVWRERREHTGRALKGPSFWLKSLLVTSIVSSIATAPFALYHFDRVAGFGVIANLVAMPVISLCAAPIAIVAAVAAPFGLAEMPLALFGRALEVILAIAHYFAGGREGSDLFRGSMPVSSLVAFSLALVSLCILKGRIALASIAPTLIGLALWSNMPSVGLHWAPNGDVFFRNEAGQLERARLADGDGLVPIGWRDLVAGSDCRGANCRFDTPFGEVTLSGLSEPTVCVAVKTRDTSPGASDDAGNSCETSLARWSRVREQGGITFLLERGRLQELTGVGCGRRPWRACRNAIRNVE